MARRGMRSSAMLVFAGVQVSTGLGTIPSELPTGTFPGSTADESNAAWPSGSQPKKLAEWPTSGTGPNRTVSPCWKVTTLHDTAHNWPGVCNGLIKAPELKTEEECKLFCRNDPRCPVWQFNNHSSAQDSGPQCWVGMGIQCASRGENSVKVVVQRSQRLQHGEVRVLKNLTGIQVMNLYELGHFTTDEDLSVMRCKAWCYSNLGCEYWQYSATKGCWVDWAIRSTNNGANNELKVQYPLTFNGGAARDDSFTHGEYIQHYCPPNQYNTAPSASDTTKAETESEVVAQSEEGGMSWAIWALAALACLLGVLGCLYYFMMQGQDGKKSKKGRGKIQPEADYEYDFQEEDKPLMKSGRSGGVQNDSYNMSTPPYPPQETASTPTMPQHSMPPPTQLVDFGGQPGYYQHTSIHHGGMRPPQLMQQGMPFPRPTTQQFMGR